MTRRNFGARLGAALAGVAAAGVVVSTAAPAKDKEAKHACKGLNECKGQGGGPKGVAGRNSCKGKGECATVKHDCKGMNECKGQGGGAMAGKNECKGKGDCAVPMKKKSSRLRMRDDAHSA
jgi:hypothetical protein